MKYTGLVVVALVLLLCTSGCARWLPSQPQVTPSVPREQSQPTLIPTLPPRFGPPGMTWYLVSLQEGNSSVRVLPDTTITAFFDGHGTVSGTAGCNQYTASCAGSQKNLTIGPPAFMKMHCGSPAGVMAQEALYLTRIQETRTYSLDGTLNFMDDRGEVILTYTLIPTHAPVPAPLVGTTWHVNSFVDASGQSLSPRKLTDITLVFGSDGYLYGNGGCNNYFGPYQKTGEDSIAIGDLRTTRIYCGIAGVMELESAYLAILPEMTGYSISGDTLLLSDAAGKVRIEFSTGSP